MVGASVAYHLPKYGFNDVILLEQGRCASCRSCCRHIVMQILCLSRLSCGTTWHAAGLLGASRGSRAHTKIVTYSNELYAKLEEETGLGTGD